MGALSVSCCFIELGRADAVAGRVVFGRSKPYARTRAVEKANLELFWIAARPQVPRRMLTQRGRPGDVRSSMAKGTSRPYWQWGQYSVDPGWARAIIAEAERSIGSEGRNRLK